MADQKYFAGFFPKVAYQGRVVTDLTRRSVFMSEIRENQTVVGSYRVKDGETAWSLAYDFYSDPDYYWILLHLNNTVDPFFGWCLSQTELERLCEFRYGSAKYDPAYWVVDGRQYLEDPANPLSIEVTNYQQEERLNEERRRIRVLRPEFLGRVVKAFENTMRVAGTVA